MSERFQMILFCQNTLMVWCTLFLLFEYDSTFVFVFLIQSSDFRLGRGHQSGHSGHHGYHSSADYTVSGSIPSRRHSHQAYSAEGARHDRHASASYSGSVGMSIGPYLTM